MFGSGPIGVVPDDVVSLFILFFANFLKFLMSFSFLLLSLYLYSSAHKTLNNPLLSLSFSRE